MNDDEDRIVKALSIAYGYGQVDGSHHKAWVIDQMVRALLGEEATDIAITGPLDWLYDYDDFVRLHNDGEDGPNTYSWNEGIAP